MSYLKVDGHDSLVRDDQTSAIVNTDTKGFHAYRNSKKAILERDKRIDRLESDITDIKDMMQQLLKRI